MKFDCVSTADQFLYPNSCQELNKMDADDWTLEMMKRFN